MAESRGVVIFNPAAGRGHASRKQQMARQLLGAGWKWLPTQYPGHAEELARQASTHEQVIVACGGDGTVGDVARGLLGSSAALGILPMGTGNDAARNLGLPIHDLPALCHILREGKQRLVDIGTINGTPFFNNAGTGFDARVMEVMNTSVRFARGQTAFLIATLKLFPVFKPFQLTLQRDDKPAEQFPAMMVSVLNGAVYGGGMRVCPGGAMSSGLLNVLVIRAMPKPQLLALLPKVMKGRHEGHPAVQLFTARRLRLDCDPPHPLNIDGDVRGTTPAEFQVRPAALRVIISI